MPSYKKFGALVALFALLCAVQLSSCAEEREPINRVQPNVIKKTMLDGVWYMQQTVVEAPSAELEGVITAGIVGMGNFQMGIGIIDWDVQKDYLYARRAYEKVENSERYDEPQDEEYVGAAIMAAFRIEKHFDIRKSYNSITGEEMNVVEENSSDRPWYEREYIRVDWSQNLAPGGTFDFELVPTAPIPYYVESQCSDEDAVKGICEQDPNSPYFRVQWSEDDPDKIEKGYFDITNSLFASPGMAYVPGYGDLPVCFLYGHQLAECGPAEYRIRYGFWHKDADRDFEPKAHKGPITNYFGPFVVDKPVYDRIDYVRYDKMMKYAQKHNIWKQHHDFNRFCTYNEDTGAIDDSACENAHGAHCDIHTPLREEDQEKWEAEHSCKLVAMPWRNEVQCKPRPHYCTLPYSRMENGERVAVREVRPIVYYTNREFPNELTHTNANDFDITYIDMPGERRPSIKQVSDEWNMAITRAINVNMNFEEPDADKETPQCGDYPRFYDRDSEEYYRENFMPSNHCKGALDWYDPERPPFTICRYAPVLGPPEEGDSEEVLAMKADEADICWEKLEEQNLCAWNEERAAELGRPLCTPRDKEPRLGDTRNSYAWWVDEFFTGFGVLGFGPNNTDPTTGEVISGMGHVYMHNDWVSTRIADMIRLMMGVVEPTSFVDGVDVTSWKYSYSAQNVNGHQYHTVNKTYNDAQRMMMAVNMGQDFTQLSNKSMSVDDLGLQAVLGGGIDKVHGRTALAKEVPDSVREILEGKKHISVPLAVDMLQQQGLNDPSRFLDDDLVQGLAGTSVEDALISGSMTPELLISSGLPSETSMDEGVLDKISPVRSTYRDLRNARETYRKQLMLSNRMDFMDMLNMEEATYEVALRLLKLGITDREDIWHIARKNLMHAVLAHEIGHTLNMFHNFGGTDDAFNYHEEYWDLRRKGAKQSYELCLEKEPQLIEECQADCENYNDVENAEVDCDALCTGLCECPRRKNRYDPNSECVVSRLDPQGIEEYAMPGPRFLPVEEGGDPVMWESELEGLELHKAYSAVMDYVAWYHVDEEGIGRWEWANILYVYGDSMEVYKKYDIHSDEAPSLTRLARDITWTNPNTEHPFTMGQLLRAYDDSNSEVFFGYIPSDNFHYTRWVGLMGDLFYRQDNRMVVPFDRFDMEPESLQGTKEHKTWMMIDDPCTKPSKSVYGFECEVAKNAGEVPGHPGIPANPSCPADYPVCIDDGCMPVECICEPEGKLGCPQNYHVCDAPGSPLLDNEGNDLGLGTCKPKTCLTDAECTKTNKDTYCSMALRQGNAYSCIPKAYSKVPYVFCNDYHADLSNKCNTRDQGADTWERMNVHVTDWDVWYLMRNFPRGMYDYWWPDYPYSAYGRTYRRMKSFNDLYAIYSNLMSSIYYQYDIPKGQFFQWNMDPYFGRGDQTAAVHEAFNLLMSTLAMPEIGAHDDYLPDIVTGEQKGRPSDGAPVFMGSDLISGDNWIDITDGRYFASSWFPQDYVDFCGDFFFDCFHHVGFAMDKMAALDVMTETEGRFVATDTSQDVREWRVNFYQNFPMQVRRFFSAMFAEDWMSIAPLVDVTNDQTKTKGIIVPQDLVFPEKEPLKLYKRDYAQPELDVLFSKEAWNGNRYTPVSTENMYPVDPQTYFTVKLYAAILGIARFQNNFDNTFALASRVWRRGSGSAIWSDVPNVEFHDPLTGVVYQAMAGYEPDLLKCGETSIYVGGRDLNNPATGFCAVDEVGSFTPTGDPTGNGRYDCTDRQSDGSCAHPYCFDRDNDGDCDLQEGIGAGMMRYLNTVKSRSHYCDATGTVGTAADDCNPDIGEITKNQNDFYLRELLDITEVLVRLTHIYDLYDGAYGDHYSPGEIPED